MGTEAGHETHHGNQILWFAYSSLQNVWNQLLDLAISNRALTIMCYYNIIGKQVLIQHICAILAFESGSYGTPHNTMSSNINTPVSANPRQSSDI